MNATPPPAVPRVLFVDDEPRILLALKAVFRADYDVVTALGGAEGIERIRAQDFDVIVSDQRMPGVTGVEVLRAARELRPRAARLLLTGYSDLSAIIGCINEGEIFRFIAKPWSNAELRATVAAAVQASAVEPLSAPLPTGLPLQNAGRPTPDRVGVLLLDDDAAARTLLRRALESDRSIYEAASVDQGLELLERHPIGVIVTELVVGGEVLTTLLSALRQHHPSLVVVVLTAHADAGHSITLINQGQIYRLLLKPVSESVLRGAVNIASRRYEMLRQNPEQIRRMAVEELPLPLAPERSGLLTRIKNLLRSEWL
jgi:response regulator RpfG family c-di-GMP phosphodiesterase